VKDKKLFDNIKNLVPSEILKIDFHYYGDGDDFDEFTTVLYLNKKGVWKSGVLSTDSEENLKKIITEYVFKIFNAAKNPPIFNNDGSAGNIIFDLTNGNIKLLNNYLDFESEEPIECDPEFFNMIKEKK